MTDLTEAGEQALLLELVRHAVHKDIITYAEIEAFLQKRLPKSGALSPYALLCKLQGCADAEVVARRIHVTILKEAVNAAKLRKSDPGYDWHALPALAHLPANLLGELQGGVALTDFS